MTVRVEPARADDLPAVLALLRQCDLLEGGVAGALPGFVVGRAGGSVVACCALEVHGGYGLLRSLAVATSERSHGLGRALVAEVLGQAEGKGLFDVYLLTTTARDYFAHRGFVTVERTDGPAEIKDSWEFRSGCPTTAVLMKYEG